MLETFTKRGLSALLVLVMVLSMLPLPAVAAADEKEVLTEPQSRADQILAAFYDVDMEEAIALQEQIRQSREKKLAKKTAAAPAETFPNTENDGHTHLETNSERVPALCEDPGMTAGTYCSLCGVTLSGREELPALGHDIQQYPAKNPTYSGVGWEAYEDCSRCGYTTYVEIPMLVTPAIQDYDTFMMYLMILEDIANSYVLENPGNDPVDLLIKYIRTGVDRYNSGSWGIMAGYEDPEFADYVALIEDMANAEAPTVDDMFAITSLKNIENFYLPNGELADIGHVFGTMDITYHNNFSENHADVGGWAGDLVDLLEFSDYSSISGTLDEMIAQINEKTFLVTAPEEVGGFNMLDFCGDLDALYLMNQLKNEGYHYEYGVSGVMGNMMAYFTEDLSLEDRADYFLKERLDGVSTRGDVRDAVYNAYTTNKVITTLEGTRDFQSEDLDTLRKAVCYTFADYVCKLAGDYVEAGENSLFTVFSSETVNLAPGINQKINMATNASGKQIVYYLATADLTREDVSLYANYNENDPTQGWAMQRVEDQANAAQARHSDPESELYIENYNVIAAVNGSGFNMSTGEPSGVLVMNGEEYHPIDSAGFVGILKDGTPVIGTKEEYNTIYKGQVQEAIACFGSRLIKDGKIVEGLTDDLASRTAIGFTKTGKVVLLVLDGRQEPFSAGGGYATLAQIMLEAGCVEATNLDGGGSTTFVAKQPGDENLSVVNRPSDGFARSVSTSWMLVSTAPSSTAFDHAELQSDYSYLTVGAQTQMSAVGISPSGNAVELPEGTYWAVSDETVGTITADGLFTAVKNGEVNVYLMLDDQVVGSETLYVVVPDNLYFTRSSLDMVYGETVQLPVKLLYQGKEVAFTVSDLVLAVGNNKAGTISGLSFTACSDENSGVSNAQIIAGLASNQDVVATLRVALYKQGELSFDFDQATGGDRQLAWQREVSNTVTDGDGIYTVVSPNEPMTTSYILAIDMNHIPIPGNLDELTYMLPGADIAGANAWTFLCQLAERISSLTEIKAVVHYDPNMELDISELKLINEYFTLSGAEVDEENSTLTLTLKWIKRSQAIDQDTANPMCIVNGLKLTPKADAQWDNTNKLKVEISGEISYKIYMRASALYSFSAKPENQAYFGLYSYINPEDSYDKGGYFTDTYKEFYDSYTLVNQLKNGWYNEDGGFTYYIEGIRQTGVLKVDGLYYNFGESGVLAAKTPYTGLFTENGNAYYAKAGETVNGWHNIGEDWYMFDWSTHIGMEGTYNTTIESVEVTYEFAGGKLLKGFWYQDAVGLQYFYGPYYYKQGWKTIDGEQYFFNEYYAATGVYPVRAAHAVQATWYEFDENGVLIGPAQDGLYWYDGALYYVEAQSSKHTGFYQIDGNYYYFKTNYQAVVGQPYWASVTNGLLSTGTYLFDAEGKVDMTSQIRNENGTRYYYENGKRLSNAGLQLIDGDYYYVGSGAIVICDQSYYVYKTNGLLPEGTYQFDSEGRMISYTGIKEEDGILYYYKDGKRTPNAGLIEFEGAYYHIDGKAMAQCNVTVWVGKTNGLIPAGTYSFGTDGKMIIYNGVVGGYYYVDGIKTNAGLIYVDGYYYYAQGGGKLVTNVSYWISATNGLLTAGTYRFDAEGRIVMTTELVNENGTLYYYKDGRRLTNAGLIQVDGDYYYVGSGAIAVVNQSYYVYKTNGLLTEGTYRFDSEGKLIVYTGIVDENGILYYYRNGRRTPTVGLIEFEGAYYHIDGKAMAQRDVTVWVSRTNGLWPEGSYTFGADGKMIIYDGIVNGYYYVEGIKTSAGLILVDGNYYYAQSGGKLVTSKSFWISATNGLLAEGTYRFDAEGKIVMTTELSNENGVLYYYKDGKRTNNAGLIQIDGSYYYVGSGAIAVVNQSFYVYKTNGLLVEGTYRFDSDGKLIVFTGIVDEDGTLYYYKDGRRTPTAGLIEFEGAYYHIDGKAMAQRDVTVWVSRTNGLWPEGSYTFGTDGKMIIYNGIVNGYYYVEGIKTGAGLILVDGNYYYAQSGGKLVTSKSFWISATNGLLAEGTYRFDAEGKIIMTTEIVDEDGTLYYYENGRRINNAGLIQIGEDYYFIGSGAIAVVNQSFYVYKPNGLLPEGTYQFGADGRLIL